MFLSYHYKLKPTKKQKVLLEKSFNATRYIYNWGLELKKKHLETFGETLGYNSLLNELTKLKQDEKWLYDVPNVCLQLSLRDLEYDFTRFFRDKQDFPHFKKKKYGDNVAKFNLSVHFDFNAWKVRFPGCKWVKICKNRKFNPILLRLSTLSVYKDRCGIYWCSIIASSEEYFSTKTQIEEEKTLGICFDNKNTAFLSDGRVKKFSKSTKLCPSSVKKLNSKQKTCKNDKTRHYIKDFIHKFTSWLIKSNYTTFCFEQIDAKKSFFHQELKRQLVYKADFYLKNLIFIGKIGLKNENFSEKAKKIKKIALNKQNLIGIDNSIKPKR